MTNSRVDLMLLTCALLHPSGMTSTCKRHHRSKTGRNEIDTSRSSTTTYPIIRRREDHANLVLSPFVCSFLPRDFDHSCQLNADGIPNRRIAC